MTAKIIIIDDEVHIRMLIAQTLEELEDQGVEILTATNGEEGLEIIRQERPRMVFLDVMMPKMNGFDVCQALRADPELSGTRILMLTAKGRDTEVSKGLGLGADGYMTKPFSTKELLAEVRKLLET